MKIGFSHVSNTISDVAMCRVSAELRIRRLAVSCNKASHEVPKGIVLRNAELIRRVYF